MAKPKVRKAKREDAKGFLDLLVALARFEKLPPPTTEAKRRIVRDIFERRLLHLLVADAESGLVGYSLYYFTYSSFLARPTLYLEDIFVLEEKRGEGVGSALFGACVREARSKGCGRMEWAVLNWNRGAISFYERVGARRLADWSAYRLEREKFEGALSRA